MRRGSREFCFKTSSPTSLLCASRHATPQSNSAKVESHHVTPFFALLFPTHFAKDNNNNNTNTSNINNINNVNNVGTSNVFLRPWHVIANLKHAVLYAMNDEERSRSKTENEPADYHTTSTSSSYHKHDDNNNNNKDTWIHKKVKDGDEGIQSGRKQRQYVSPSDIVRLVRDSIRLVQQNKQETTSQIKEMEDKVGYEGELLRTGIHNVPKERFINYVLDGSERRISKESEAALHPLHLALRQTRRSSAYAFHLTFETLVRQGQSHMAVELFRRWWRHNPHLFPIELEGPHLEEDILPMLSTIRAAAEKEEGTSVVSIKHWDIISRRLARIPYKKYMISSALFTRVLMVAIKLGGKSAIEDEFILQEVIYKGVYMTCCASQSKDLYSNQNNNNNGETTAAASSRADLNFHLFREKYEDWLVLIGAITAAAMLERHVEDFFREQRGGGLSYDRLVSTVREEYMRFMRKAYSPHSMYSTEARSSRTQRDSARGSSVPHVDPGWTKLLFVTVLRCYEEAGVFHASPVRRPGNTSAMWRQIHARLIRQFPHVFHAGNTVTTLLTFAALEEAGVSSLGTHRMSFCGKEEALCRWRLECLSEKGVTTTDDSRKNTLREVKLHQSLSDLPRASRRLRARFVAAYCSLSGTDIKRKEEGMEEEEEEEAEGSSLDNKDFADTNRGKHTPQQQQQQQGLHWKHRELFGNALNVSASQLSIPVFVTPEEVINYAEDALGELDIARQNIIEIFREHASLPMLCPATPVHVLDPRERRSRGDILAEASQPSMFLFLRLVSLLSLMGEAPVESSDMGEKENESEPFALVTCIEEDILPYCHPSVAASLRRCCTTYLSRSGVHGIHALVTKHQSLLEQLTEEAAVERLLVGVLWGSPHDGDVKENDEEQEEEEEGRTISKHHHYYSFGSGSLAWRVIAQHRHIILRSDGPSLLEMVLSHLVTLSLTIPDDYRRIVYVSPCMHSIIADSGDNGDEEDEDKSDMLSVLSSELNWNPSSARHVYISLLELLSWTVGKRSKEGNEKGVSQEAGNCLHNSADTTKLSTLAKTAHHWKMIQHWLRSSFSSSKLFPPSVLERICLILVHSCPDVELMVACLLALCHAQPPRHSQTDVCTGTEKRKIESHSFFTPRLLTSLSALLVMNGCNGNSVLQWRRENGAPPPPSPSRSSSSCDGSADKNRSMHEWHLTCFERMLPVATRTGSSVVEDSDDGSGFGMSAAVHLLGSILLDVLLSDSQWQSLRNDNYYTFLFTSGAELNTTENTNNNNSNNNRAEFPFAVLLPSRQMSSSYPAGVRQRVTNVKDAVRELGAEGRMRFRRSMPQGKKRRDADVLKACLLVHEGEDDDVDEEEEAAKFFRRSGAGVEKGHSSWIPNKNF